MARPAILRNPPVRLGVIVTPSAYRRRVRRAPDASEAPSRDGSRQQNHGATYMKTILTVAASTAALVGVDTAAAQDAGQDTGSIYLELGLGAAFATDDDVRTEGTFSDFEGGTFEDTFEGSLELSAGAAFHILAGYEVTPNVAIELQSQGTAAEIDDEDVFFAMNVVTVNAVYTGDRAASVIPYAGIGIGIANPSLFDDDGDEIDDDLGTAFAYQAKAGVMKPVGVHHNFAAEVRYVGTSGFSEDFEDEFMRIEDEIDYGAITATINYRYRFGARPGR